MKKKHPTLPNGFGSIRYLGAGRSRPYAVHPPATKQNEKGRYITPKAICYCSDWYTAFAVLTAWHQGRYVPGMEYEIQKDRESSYADLDAFCRRVLATIGASAPVRTFGQVADEYMEFKYGKNAPKQLAYETHRSDKASRNHLAPLDSSRMESLSLDTMQTFINSLPGGSGVKVKVATLIKQIFKYALSRGYISRDESALLHAPRRQDVHGEPFTDEDLQRLWKDRQNPDAQMILIMCYSGFRVSAYSSMEINMQDLYFRGGVKTAAGKGRIVPIHSAIIPLVRAQISRRGLFSYDDRHIYLRMVKYLQEAKIQRHTPHDCRHTFSRLLEKYNVPEADRKRLIGHSFGGDITGGVYGHRTVEELRQSIELITVTSCDK